MAKIIHRVATFINFLAQHKVIELQIVFSLYITLTINLLPLILIWFFFRVSLSRCGYIFDSGYSARQSIRHMLSKVLLIWRCYVLFNIINGIYQDMFHKEYWTKSFMYICVWIIFDFLLDAFSFNVREQIKLVCVYIFIVMMFHYMI